MSSDEDALRAVGLEPPVDVSDLSEEQRALRIERLRSEADSLDRRIRVVGEPTHVLNRDDSGTIPSAADLLERAERVENERRAASERKIGRASCRERVSSPV